MLDVCNLNKGSERERGSESEPRHRVCQYKNILFILVHLV